MSTLIQTIVQSEFRFPEGETLGSVLPHLLDNLGSANPQARTDSLSIFSNWISNNVFPDDWLSGILLEKSLEGMHHKLGSAEDDSVFVRSYFALLLLNLLHHNLEHTIFKRVSLQQIHMAVTETFLGERDYRAVVPGNGWAYSVPHVCDNYWKLIQTEGLEAKLHEATLKAIGTRLQTTGTHIFEFLEDERLAYVALATLKQGLITTNFFETWLTQLTKLPNSDNSYLAIVELPKAQHVTYCNTRQFLRSFYLQLNFRQNPPATSDTFCSILEKGLKRLDPGFYSSF